MTSRRSPHDSNFGTAVSDMLTAAKMNQRELAAVSGKTLSYVNQTLTGNKHVSPAWADFIADIFNASAADRMRLHQAAARDVGYKLDLTLPPER